MLRLHQLFFISFLFIFIATLLLSGIITYFTLRDNGIREFENHSKNLISIIEFELNNITELKSFGDSLFKNRDNLNNIRITIIDSIGNVVTESHKDLSTMENHINREEVIQANSKEFATSIRLSSTTNKSYLYVAKKIELLNQAFYIRVATDINTITDSFYSLWLKITLLFSLSVSVGLFMTYFISKKIQSEITNIKDILEHLQNKAYKPEFREPFAYEFDIILRLIKKLAKKLEKRSKDKKKFTKKLILRDIQNKEIISAISHEFKNPIAVILGYCETLTADTNINPKIRDKFLGKIHSNSQRIANIIDRISISIKLENGDFKLSLSEFNLLNLLNNTISLIKDKYKDREILLEFNEDSEFKMSADKTLIELVLMNLIENALKYSSSEVVISVNNKEISVIDKGIGIDKDDIALVTKKFYRVNKNIWNNSLGLGLNIVKYILKLHQKELIIESEINKGSIFKFNI